MLHTSQSLWLAVTLNDLAVVRCDWPSDTNWKLRCIERYTNSLLVNWNTSLTFVRIYSLRIAAALVNILVISVDRIRLNHVGKVDFNRRMSGQSALLSGVRWRRPLWAEPSVTEPNRTEQNRVEPSRATVNCRVRRAKQQNGKVASRRCHWCWSSVVAERPT